MDFHILYACCCLKIIDESIEALSVQLLYLQAALAFLADSSVVGLGSQRVNDIT
jgi:hypothetical protein